MEARQDGIQYIIADGNICYTLSNICIFRFAEKW